VLERQDTVVVLQRLEDGIQPVAVGDGGPSPLLGSLQPERLLDLAAEPPRGGLIPPEERLGDDLGELVRVGEAGSWRAGGRMSGDGLVVHRCALRRRTKSSPARPRSQARQLQAGQHRERNYVAGSGAATGSASGAIPVAWTNPDSTSRSGGRQPA